MAQHSILFADGDSNLTDYFTGILKANGFNAVGTSSGLKALALYKNGSVDLVIADLSLSEMDGLTLLDEIKNFNPASSVVLTTDNADKDLVTRAFRNGALDILEKPLDPEFLITRIRDLLKKEDRALEGNLQMMSLASIIQINCEERNTAQLKVNYLGKVGMIYFKDGDMVHAQTGDLIGDEAIYSLLSWNEGAFQVRLGVEASMTTITKKWSGLLLEGMRRIDESSADWSQNWEEETFPEVPDPGNQLQERITKAIQTHRDVSGVVMTTIDGTLLAHEGNTEPESAIEFGIQLAEKADSIGGYLDGGNLERIVLTGHENRFYLQIQAGEMILLSLAKRSSAESVYESVQTIYSRYQSA